MTFTLTFAWWWIPAAITVVGLIWALKSGNESDGWFSVVAIFFNVMLVLAVSGWAWAIAGFFK